MIPKVIHLTQFVFHERGRRTQEAVKKYFEDVMEKIHSTLNPSCANHSAITLRRKGETEVRTSPAERPMQR